MKNKKKLNAPFTEFDSIEGLPNEKSKKKIKRRRSIPGLREDIKCEYT